MCQFMVWAGCTGAGRTVEQYGRRLIGRSVQCRGEGLEVWGAVGVGRQEAEGFTLCGLTGAEVRGWRVWLEEVRFWEGTEWRRG